MTPQPGAGQSQAVAEELKNTSLSTKPVLEAVALSRSFGPIEVLSDVSIGVRAGEVHAIIGENGAGKSTLMKILSGHLAPSRGAIKLDGSAVELKGPVDAERRGIVLVHQEIMLAPDLSIAENMFLGRELWRGLTLDDAEMNRRAAEAMRVFGVEATVTAPVQQLSIAQRQLAQIARALAVPHRIAIFDEPTASLTPVETTALLNLIRELKAKGVAVLYISHRLEEVKAVADVVTVLRDGKRVATRPAAELEPLDMARLMVGRDLLALYPPRPPAPTGEPAFEVAHFGAAGFAEDASFSVRPGEILGFSGLVGAGRTELFEALFGLRKGGGEIRINGAAQQWRDARAGMRAGAVYLTEDRKSKGLLLEETIATNLTLAALDKFQRGPLVDRAKESPRARRGDPAFRHPGRRQEPPRRTDVGRQPAETSSGENDAARSARRRDRRAYARNRHRRQAADLSIHRRARGGGPFGDRHLVGNGRTDRHLPPHHRHAERPGRRRSGGRGDERARDRRARDGRAYERGGSPGMTQAVREAPVAAPRRRVNVAAVAPFAALALICALGALANPRFLSFDNLTNVLARSTFIATIAVGQTLVITGGGLDLSVGAMAAFISGLTILFLNSGLIDNMPLLIVSAMVLIARGRRAVRPVQRPDDDARQDRAVHRDARHDGHLPLAAHMARAGRVDHHQEQRCPGGLPPGLFRRPVRRALSGAGHSRRGGRRRFHSLRHRLWAPCARGRLERGRRALFGHQRRARAHHHLRAPGPLRRDCGHRLRAAAQFGQRGDRARLGADGDHRRRRRRHAPQGRRRPHLGDDRRRAHPRSHRQHHAVVESGQRIPHRRGSGRDHHHRDVGATRPGAVDEEEPRGLGARPEPLNKRETEK